jgi:hypothetical protein
MIARFAGNSKIQLKSMVSSEFFQLFAAQGTCNKFLEFGISPQETKLVMNYCGWDRTLASATLLKM